MVTNLSQYLKQQLLVDGEKIAVRDKDDGYTFDELDNISKCIASAIKNKSPKQNIPVILFMDKTVKLYSCIYGVLYSGNYYVPLDTKSPVERLQKIFSVVDAEIAIVDDKYKDYVRENGFNGEVIIVDDVSQTECFDVDLSGIIDTDPAYMLFTSGSTGIPKGVLVSHRTVIDYIEWQNNTLIFDDETVLGNQAPFYFDASMPDIFTPVSVGCELVIIPEKLFLLPNKLIEFINEYGINSLIWVPSALINMVQKDYFQTQLINNLRQVMFCGSVMPNRHLNIWRKYYPDTQFVNLYGPTEAGYACTYYIVDRPFANHEMLPLGKACENTRIMVIDGDELVTKEGEGELYLAGSCLAIGYYKDEDKTNKSFIRNPFNSNYYEKVYKTGDLVRYDDKGNLEFITRKDFQIKHHGYRIELGEIESACYTIDNIKECCVIYDKESEQINLFVIDEELDEKRIYSSLKMKLPKYMLPAKIVLLDQFPLNPNGKIDRNILLKLVRG